MSSTRHTRRRNLRTATLATVALAGITLPMGAAMADSPAVPARSPSVSQPATDVDSGSKPSTGVDNGGQERTRREAAGAKTLPGGYVAELYRHVSDGPTKEYKVKGWEAEIHRVKGGGLATTLKAFGKSDTRKADAYTFTLSASGEVSARMTEGGGSGKPDKPQDQVAPKTHKLKDGGSAKVNWILGKPRAELFDKAGKAVGALEEPGASKTLATGLKVTLEHGGGIKQEWTGNKPGGDKDRHDYDVRTVRLQDGGKAVVSKARNGEYGAQLFDKNDNGGPNLDAAKPTATLKSGLKVTLAKDGKISQEWTTTPGGGVKPSKPGTIVPKGGVKAGAEGVESGSEGTALLTAAGGAAAAGAAGTGFVVLRRRRTDG
ncbi:hypothetical protein ACFWP3_36120 [Streptomyces sp. NPDC058525]|uniref:hypothetical protein n=1 Tax=Streptomyces sp. NPDC058525 TaxID=3346538 RepID=UPI00364A3BFC